MFRPAAARSAAAAPAAPATRPSTATNPLSRPTTKTATEGGTTTTEMVYLGVSDAVVRETETGASTKERSYYAFDLLGERRDDPEKAFHIYKGCSRRWMNLTSDERGTSGISILWPDTSNFDYRVELGLTKAGESPNNISCIIQYSLENGVRMVWIDCLLSS